MASVTDTNIAHIAVMDSGLGGISVVRALRQTMPALGLIYVADTAGFPYGKRSAPDITARGIAMVTQLLAAHNIARIVVACNTLSTLSLAAMRGAFPAIPFVGTVPAIKVAAQQSQSRRFSLLATPNTATSPYSKSLIDQFADGCVVDCHGAPELACMSEALLLGEAVDDGAWRAQIAPCFFDDARGKTDQVVLGCTHYPLVLDQLQKHAPWPVTWVDSSQAIARQTLQGFAVPGAAPSQAYVTRASDVARYRAAFAREGLGGTTALLIDADQDRIATHA